MRLSIVATVLLLASLARASSAVRTGGVQQFDFMLGEWESTSHWMDADQSLRRIEARHRFARAFGGQGVVDDNFKRLEDGERYWGTAIRTYDPEADAWTCRWYDGELRGWTSEFVLREQEGILTSVTEGQDEHGAYTDRIQFRPVDEDTVQWSMVRSYAGLPTPLTIGSIEYRRVQPGRSAR